MALLVYETPEIDLPYTKTALLVYETPEIDLSYTKMAFLVYETSKRGTEEGGRLRFGKFDGEAGSAQGEGAGIGDGAAAVLYDSFADSQTQAAATGLGGEVGGEDLVLVLFGDARAVVFYHNVVEAVFVGIADGYQQAARGVHVFHRLDGVGDEVHHHAG